MQNIIVEKPYNFVPPDRGKWLFDFIQACNFYSWRLAKVDGVIDHECRGVEHLKASLRAGHGILLTPNHCRYADPMVMGFLIREAKCRLFTMASWHLFNQNRLLTWAIRKMGGFSVNREGVDRQAINAAIEILDSAERPLVIFPEGAVSRTNDRLHALLDGISFIARTAAKRRAKRDGGEVVVHPVGIKYIFSGDIEQSVDGVLTDIEHRLSWRPQRHVPLIDRIGKVGQALLSLKEIEHFGRAHEGDLAPRLSALIDRLLQPLEQEWLGEQQHGAVVPRVKSLRLKIIPEMIRGVVDAEERTRRWDHLADIYLAQQISCYPADYLTKQPSVDRILETVERFEEDLTDKARIHSNLKVIVEVGPPLKVSPKRDRRAETDPLMVAIEQQLQEILDRLATESRVYDNGSGSDMSTN